MPAAAPVDHRLRALRLISSGLVLAALAFPACTSESPEEVVRRYVTSWSRGDAAVRATVSGPDAEQLVERIGVVRSFVAGRPRLVDHRRDGNEVSATVALPMKGGPELRLSIAVTVDGGRIRAEPTAFDRRLTSWREVRIESQSIPSGRLLDRFGAPLDARQRAALIDAVRPVFGERLGGGTAYQLWAGNEVLDAVEVVPAGDVTLAIDPAMESAALGAIGDKHGRALVVIDAATGEVVAFASDDADGRPLAVTAIPVGSVFKVATAAAALLEGRSPDDAVPCPAAAVIEERSVVNASQFDLGDLSLRRAFALSCNTSFAQLGVDLGGDAVVGAARSLGFDTRFAGVEPAAIDAPDSGEEEAAFGFGAAGIEVSPVILASVTATIGAGGIARAPSWVPTVSPGERVIEEGVAASLIEMMHDAVENGTAQRAAVEGVDVAAKTGTPRRIVDGVAVDDGLTVAVVRLDGRVFGVAAVVLEGDTGSKSAAPLIADFIRSISSKFPT